MKHKLDFYKSNFSTDTIYCNTAFEYFLKKNNYQKGKNDYYFLKRNSKLFWIKKCLNLIFQVKFRWSNPPQKKIIIFDHYSETLFKWLFEKNQIYELRTRADAFNEMFLSPSIILLMIKNFLKFPIKLNYLIAVITVSNPKLVISSVENSKDFSVTSEYFKKKIHCILFKNTGSKGKGFFFQKIFCFGNKVENYNKYKRFGNVNIIPPIQSLYIKSIKKKIMKKKNNFQICLIDKNMPKANLPNQQITYDDMKREEDYFLLLKHLNKLCSKHKFKIVIAIKSKDKLDINYRLFNFKKYLKDTNYSIVTRKQSMHSSYQAIINSDIVIGCDSSILNHSLLLDKKVILFKRLSKNKTFFLGNNFARIKTDKFSKFEKIFLKIKTIKKNVFFTKTQCKKYRDFNENFNLQLFKTNLKRQFINEK